jgi:hypothetical protein
MEVGSKAKFVGYFSPELSSSANRGPHARVAWGRRKLKEQRIEGQCNTGLGAYGATRPLGQSIYLNPLSADLKVKKGKAALLRLFDTDAYWHIVSLPLTEFTPSSSEALHTKQASALSASKGVNYM